VQDAKAEVFSEASAVLSLLLALNDAATAPQASAGLIKPIAGFRAGSALLAEELDSWCDQHVLDAVLGNPEAAALAVAGGDRGDDDDEAPAGGQLLHFTQLLRQLNGPLQAPALGLLAADARLGAAPLLQLPAAPGQGVQLLGPAAPALAKGQGRESPTSVLDGPEGAAGRPAGGQQGPGGAAALPSAHPAAAAAVPDAANLATRQQLAGEQQLVEAALAAVSGSAACLAQIKAPSPGR
jgi:hypothetical protein